MKTRLFSFVQFSFFCVLLLIGCFFVSCSKQTVSAERAKEVVVYAYDSFVSEWGPGPELITRFEASSDYTLTFISCGDAGQVLSRAVVEKKNPQADVLLGIDNNLVQEARSAAVLTPYKSALADSIPQELLLDSDWYLTPYDWGYFAFIFDTASGINPPKSLEDLKKAEYAKKVILMDPRTSTPGLGFLAWTIALYGDSFPEYWKAIAPSILTLAPGWDSGYGLFTAGEAPLVLSYTTSPAYHVEYEETNRYQALIFDEGHSTQIEGMGLVSGAKNTAGAQAFIDFMLSDAAQEVLPLTQFMYPVSQTVTLPSSFDAAPKASKTVSASSEEVSKAVDQVVTILSK